MELRMGTATNFAEFLKRIEESKRGDWGFDPQPMTLSPAIHRTLDPTLACLLLNPQLHRHWARKKSTIHPQIVRKPDAMPAFLWM
jgi:hypothetical protein